jgi:hypothetical protein
MYASFALISAAVLSSQPAAPDWVAPPQARFPHAADAAGITEGSVQLRCDAASDGVLSNCVVLSEEPQGVGFAEAALASLLPARLAPVPPGQPRPTATFTIHFALEGGPAPSGERDVVLDCELLEDGSVRDCHIEYERPEARGLGEWLMARPHHLRTDPQPDWRPGDRTTITIYSTPPTF